jgi:hypothetical protein
MMLTLTALCLVQPARAGESPSAFDAANRAFVEGKPAEAARTLESITAKQGYSAALLYNLANAQLRAGQAGQAILNYERARWLAPRDPDIAANLRLALQRTQAALPADRLLLFADWFTVNGWAGLAAASLFLFVATLPLALLRRHQRFVLPLARLLAAVMLAGSLTAIGARWGALNRAVVVAKSAPARIAPVSIGAAMFSLTEGALVNIVKSHGPFTLVSTRDGQRGWVNRDTIEPVISSVTREGAPSAKNDQSVMLPKAPGKQGRLPS